MTLTTTRTKTIPVHPQLLKAFNYLSGVCDGAATLDGQGFNGLDARNDFVLFCKGKSDLNYEDQIHLWNIIKKYTKQLKKAGIEWVLKTNLEKYLKGFQSYTCVQDCSGWAVTNDLNGHEYLVTELAQGLLQCDCERFQHTGNCGHTLAVADRQKENDEWMDDPVFMDHFVAPVIQSKPIQKDRFSEYRDPLKGQQQELFDLAIYWWRSNPSQPFVIRGHAGTGKSYSAQQILKAITSLNHQIHIAACAPTHKAKHILELFAEQAGIKIHISTLHSLLHLIPGQPDADGNRRMEENKYSTEPHYSEFDLVLVDESSMIGDELFKWIPYQRVPTIFMGDPSQLPPVDSEEEDRNAEPKPSPIFSLPVGIELTQVQRYEGAIADFVTSIRNNMESQFHVPKSKGNIKRLGVDAWLDEMISDFKHQKENKLPSDYVRALAWTNSRVNFLNEHIRREIYPDADQKYVQGERLMAKEPIMIDVERTSHYDDGQTRSFKEIVMNTCAECTVREVSTSSGVFLGHEIETFLLTVVTDMGREFKLQIPSDASWEKVKTLLNTHKAATLKETDSNKKRRMWREYYALLEDFNLVVKGKSLLPRLQYALALTIHQSQGSTFNRCYVDMSNVWGCRQVKHRNQLLYVACSRASEQLFVAAKF